MEHLGGIPLTEPRTLEVDVLVGPSLLGTFVENVNDDTFHVLLLVVVLGVVFVCQIERPEERGDTVVVRRAHLLGSVHMMNDGMNELDKEFVLFGFCLDHEGSQSP